MFPYYYKLYSPMPLENNKTFNTIITLLLVVSYALLFYFIFSYHRIDFSSLYSACLMLNQESNPYHALLTTFFPHVEKLPTNLNPPIALLLFHPLSLLNYNEALFLWSLLSFSLGLIGANLAFNYSFSTDFLTKHRLYLNLIYLASFAAISNTLMAQLGSLLLFCLMAGYRLSLNRRDFSTGIVWGFIFAIKLFPGLLLVYAFLQKRYTVCLSMLATFLLLWLLPYLIYGEHIYRFYFSMMSQVFWYGDNWNASIYGLIFRLFVNPNLQYHHVLWIDTLYAISFLLCFILYIKKVLYLEKEKLLHQSFCLTLVMMLFLSPFGWLYYFPILIFPLALTWLTVVNEQADTHKVFLWFLCFFLINFPMNYMHAEKMVSLGATLTLYSFHFYGLLLLLYLTTKIKINPHPRHPEHREGSSSAQAMFRYAQHNAGRWEATLYPVFIVICAFDLLVIIVNLSLRLF